MTQPASVAHHELHELRAQLTDILVAIDAYQHPIAAPPILDGVPPSGGGVDGPQHVESVSGLRALKDAVRRDLAVLSKVSLPSHYVSANGRAVDACLPSQ